MAAQTLDVILNRIGSICADVPFEFGESVSPFDFDQQPSGNIDQVFRLTAEPSQVIGGFNYTEERHDRIEVWVARKMNPDANVAYRLLAADVGSITAAIVRDGATGGGDYAVMDQWRGSTFKHSKDAEFCVARLQLTVDYESAL